LRDSLAALVAAPTRRSIMDTRTGSHRARRGTAALLASAGIAAAALVLAASCAHASGIGVRGAWVDTPGEEDNAQMVGGFLRLGNAIALEGAVDYRSTEIGGGAEMRTWPVTLSLVASPIPFLYGVAGIGWYNTTLELSPALGGMEDTWREFGYHAGGGVQLPIVPYLSFVGDLRYSYVGYEFDEFADAVSDFDGGDYLALNLGVMLGFPERE
jgi:hypothetical protein